MMMRNTTSTRNTLINSTTSVSVRTAATGLLTTTSASTSPTGEFVCQMLIYNSYRLIVQLE